MINFLKAFRSFLLLFIAPLVLIIGAVSLVIPDAPAVAGPTFLAAGWLAKWFTWDTALYLAIIVLVGLISIVSLKYRAVIVELKEFVETIRKAYEDKQLTDAERKAILKEFLDVLWAIIKLAWLPGGLTAKAIKKAVK